MTKRAHSREKRVMVATLTKMDRERLARMGTLLTTKEWIDRQEGAIADDWFRAWKGPVGAESTPRLV